MKTAWMHWWVQFSHKYSSSMGKGINVIFQQNCNIIYNISNIFAILNTFIPLHLSWLGLSWNRSLLRNTKHKVGIHPGWLDGTSTHNSAPHICWHTHTDLGAIKHNYSAYWQILNCVKKKKTENPEDNPHKHREKLCINTIPNLGSNQELWSCEVEMLPFLPTFC